MNKKSELNIMINDSDPHIIGITESWANNDITDAELGLERYVMFRKDRMGRRGGGVLLSSSLFIIRQPLCPVVGRRPQHAVSKLPCLVLFSAISCRSNICLGRLSTAWLVSLVVFSCHMVSKW